MVSTEDANGIKIFYHGLQMLQIRSLIYYLFYLVLISYLYLFLNLIYKDPKFSRAIMQKYLQVILIDKNQHLSFDFILIMLSYRQNFIFKKNGDKKNLVETPSYRYDEVIYALLYKIIAVYINFILNTSNVLAFEDTLKICQNS